MFEMMYIISLCKTQGTATFEQPGAKIPTQFKLQQLLKESLERDKQFPLLQQCENSPAAPQQYLHHNQQVPRQRDSEQCIMWA